MVRPWAYGSLHGVDHAATRGEAHRPVGRAYSDVSRTDGLALLRAAVLDLASAKPGRVLEPSLGALDHLLLAVFGVEAGALDVAAVGLHVPRAALIRKLRVEHVPQLLLQPRILDRAQHLDALLEVALHRIGRADVVLGAPGVVEVVDARVLEEAADHADDLDRR